MSDAPLFQNADEEEALYGSDAPTAEEDIVVVPGAALGGSGVGSPALGAGTPGALPPAIAPVPEDTDDQDTTPSDDR